VPLFALWPGDVKLSVLLGEAVLALGTDPQALDAGLKSADSKIAAWSQRMGELLDLHMPTDGITEGMQRLAASAEKTQVKIDSVSASLELQRRQHGLLAQSLATLTASEKATEEQIEKKRLALDKSAQAIANSEQRLASYRAALQGINQDLSQAGQEAAFGARFRSYAEAVGLFVSSVEQVAPALDPPVEKMEELAAKISRQERLLAVLGAELEQTSEKYGENSTQAERARIRIDELTEQIEKAKRALSGMGGELNDAADELRKFENAGKGGGSDKSLLLGFVGGIGAGVVDEAVDQIKEGVRAIADGMIGGNAAMEEYRTRWETLLGSMSAAEIKIGELRDFAAKTPFEMPEILTAAQNLRTLGGVSADTQENLTLVGNAAAATGAAVEEASFWIARAYQGMDSGRPWGEAALRLQELGILGGEARTEIEALTKSGASGAEVWQLFTERINAPAGAMDKLGQTFNGLASTAKDSAAQILEALGADSFDNAKDGLQDLLGLYNVNRGAVLEWASDVGRSVGEMEEAAAVLARAFGEDLKLGTVANDIKLLAGGVELLARTVEENEGAIGILTGLLTANFSGANQWSQAWAKVGDEIDRVNEVAENLENPIDDRRQAIDQFNTNRIEGSRHAATEEARIAEEQLKHELSIVQDKIRSQEDYNQTHTRLLKESEREDERHADAVQKIKEQYAQTEEDAQEKVAERQGKLREELTSLAEQHTQKQADLARQLSELEQEAASDSADRRKDLLGELAESQEQYNEKRADLERQIAETEADYQRDSRDRAKDHQQALLALDEEHASKKAEIQQKISDLEANHQQDNQDRYRDYTQALSDLDEKHADKIAEIQERISQLMADYQREGRSEYQSYLSDLADLNQDYADKQADVGRQLRDLSSEHRSEGRDREAEHYADLTEMAEDYADARTDLERQVSDLQSSYADAVEDRANDLERRLESLSRSYEKKASGLQSDIEEILGKAREVAPAQFEYDEATQTYRQVEASTEELLQYLSESDRRRVLELQGRLSEERAAYEAAAQEARDRATEEEAEAKEQHERKLQQLRERLQEEEAEYQKAQADAKRRYEQDVADAAEAYVQRRGKLSESLAEERKEYEEQTADLKAQYEAQVAEAQASYASKLSALQSSLAEENATYQQQQADLGAKYEADTTKATAEFQKRLSALQASLSQEDAEYSKQQASLTGKYDEQTAKAVESHTRKLASLQEKLASEEADYQKQQASILSKYDEQTTKAQEQYAKQYTALMEKIAAEDTEYAAQRARLETDAAKDFVKYQEQLAERKEALTTKLAEEVEEHDKSRADIEAREAEAVETLKTRMAELDQAMRDGPLTTAQELSKEVEYLKQLAAEGPIDIDVNVNANIDPDLKRHSPSIVEQTLMAIKAMTAAPFTVSFRADTSALSDAAQAVRDTVNTSRSGQQWRNQSDPDPAQRRDRMYRNQPDTEGTGTRGGGMWRSNPQAQQQAQQSQQTAKAVQAYTQAVTTGASDTKKATQQLQSAIQSTVASVTNLGNASSRAASQADRPPRVHSASQRLYDNPPPGGWNSGGGIIESDDGSYGRIGNYFIRPRGSNLGGGEALLRVPRGQEHLGGIGGMTVEQLLAFRGTAASYGLLDAVEQRLAELGHGTPPPPTTGGVGPATAPSVPAPGKQITINQTIYAPDQETVHRGNRQSLLMAELL
jgi:chromosome segregation ATPase